jgi:hypothetical protein
MEDPYGSGGLGDLENGRADWAWRAAGWQAENAAQRGRFTPTEPGLEV